MYLHGSGVFGQSLNKLSILNREDTMDVKLDLDLDVGRVAGSGLRVVHGVFGNDSGVIGWELGVG